jgi:Fic-DOC domain mobile mystery protein B
MGEQLSGLLDGQDQAATALNDEEKEGLLLSYVTLRSELNEAEHSNILEAQEWSYARKRNVLDEKFLNNLHRRMFGNVWAWAGAYRRTGKNIGVDAYRIPTELRQLLDDCRYWIELNTYGADEMATRFHHKLVWIDAYSNGNGRHARLATDLLLNLMSKQPFSWGRTSLTNSGETRKRYIEALQSADRHDFSLLLEFVKS